MVGFSLTRTVPVLFTLVAALALGCGPSEPEAEIRGPGGEGGWACDGSETSRVPDCVTREVSLRGIEFSNSRRSPVPRGLGAGLVRSH